MDGCSPIMRYNTRAPSLGCFDLPLLPVANGHPARCEALFDVESSDEDTIDYVPPLLAHLAHVDSDIISPFGGLMRNVDYSDFSVRELKAFREHHAILYGYLFPKLRGIVDELKKRAPTEAVFESEVAGVKLLFPEVEPDGEPDEVPVEQPSGSTDTASITYSIKNMTAEPFVIKPLTIFVSSSVANLRDEVLKLFGIPLARGKSVKLFVARSQKYIHENIRVKIATVMSKGDLKLGDEIEFSMAGKGGVRSYKPVQKDKEEKAKGYKTSIGELAGLVDRELLAPLPFMSGIEEMLNTFVANLEVDAEKTFLGCLSKRTINEIDEMFNEVSQKGGTTEMKISKWFEVGH